MPTAIKQHQPTSSCSSISTEYLKCDVGPWEDVTKRYRASNPVVLSSSCRFIKDEKEPLVIMDTPADLSALDTCCDPQRKQLLTLPGSETNAFSAVASRSVQDGSPNFLIDMNPLEPLALVRSRSPQSGKPLVSFDVSAHTSPPPHHQMFKSEVSRWPMHTTFAEPNYWGQSTGVPGEPFTHAPYEGHPNQSLVVRNPSPFSTFPGMPPQRQCVICSDEASGCHYGVLTCGSCKVFFKRAVEGHHSYLCAGRNDCIVDKIRRKNCPACRLRKCYQAGMVLGGRKLKRFGALKALGLSPSLMFQSNLAMPGENQALNSMSLIPSLQDVQLHQIHNILENIEPEMVYSGFDNSQPDVPHILLNSLNRLCEKQLLWIVKWSKSLPGFGNLHLNDQMTLIQYSWMNIIVFSLGWRTFQNVTSEYLYFAPDLVLSQEQLSKSPIHDPCLAIQFIPQEFANLQVTREEFLCMKAIILLNTVPLEGLKSQAAFEEMRQNYIRELSKAIHMKEKGAVGSSQRFYHLTKLMDGIHDIVKKANLSCLSTFIRADTMRVEFPKLMSEVIASQLPKVLAGMVRLLLFHTK
ncbi:progesterone receptor-like [Eucyclogobius newberryi]|uniref:progesterone receptor-like n=1 Tax=Eucyclogobius newberryi TaxID=166745 RepID=UPI003B59D70C